MAVAALATFPALLRLALAEVLRQRLTLLITLVDLLLVLGSAVFGVFSFQEEDRLRLLCTAGVAVGTLGGLLLATVLAASAIQGELASRSSLILLSKPVSRGAWLTARILAAWLAAAASLILTAGAHLILVGLVSRFGFSFLEIGTPHVDFDPQQLEYTVPWLRLLAGHGLAIAHAALFASLAGTLALRLKPTGCIIAALAVFVGSHLLAGSGLPGAVLIPDLALLNLDEAIRLPDETPFPASYFLLSLLYVLTYGTACLLTALTLFRRQDLA